MAKASTKRNLWGIGEKHAHYTRTSSGGFRAVAKTPKRTVSKTRTPVFRDDQGFYTKFDPDSRFDTREDAQRFLKAWKKNPKAAAKLPRRKRNDVIDEAAKAGMGLQDAIYEGYSIPYTVTRRAISEALKGKDALKKAVLKNLQSKLQKANPKTKRGKKNPDQEAADLYESFHGKPSEEEITVVDKIHRHGHLGALGALVCCKIDTPTGLAVTLSFDNPAPYLCSSEDGKQLYIKAGNQEVDLEALKMDGPEWVKDRMVLGCFSPARCPKCHEDVEKNGSDPVKPRCENCGHKFDEADLYNIIYQTEKSFDDFSLVDYAHDLGEPDEGSKLRRDAPYLEYEPRNKLLYVTGGNYEIKMPLLGVSPGIEG